MERKKDGGVAIGDLVFGLLWPVMVPILMGLVTGVLFVSWIEAGSREVENEDGV